MDRIPMTSTRACSVGRAIRIIGEARVILALREIFFGNRRFDEIQAALCAPRATVAERLAHLVDQALIERRRYLDRPPRYEYRLTEQGRDLYPAIVLLMQWGDRWMSADRRAPLLLRHKPCGHLLRAVCRCSYCSRELDPHLVSIEPGPGVAGPDCDPHDRRPRRTSHRAAYERGRPCSVARSLSVIGDRWTFLILREAFFGARRFDAFAAGTGAATNILADRLASMVADGVLARRPGANGATIEYQLTNKGLDLYPASLALLSWGDRWLSGDAGPPLRLRHQTCGELFTTAVVCKRCGEPVRAEQVSYKTRYGAVRSPAIA